ncbi:AAA family ATPase [Photobacterium phosphoreum]|uniref:AAA family ATPase n=1 Tax=Photobacterium phosphoreum TaxID=659 RepID=UPI003B969610
MLYNPSLEICKVLAIKNNKEIYNETFHSGINILSGRNGTGKTSILQLIVYGSLILI